MKYYKLLWFTILIISLELIYRVLVFNTFFSIYLLYLIIFSLPFSILLTILSSIFNKKVNKILTVLFSLILIIIYYAQIIYYNFYLSVISVYSLFHGTGQVMKFFKDILYIIIDKWYLLGIILIILVILFFINKHINNYVINKKTLKVYISSYVLLTILSLLLIRVDKSNYNLYYLSHNTNAPLIYASKVGLLSTIKNDITKSIFGYEVKVNMDEIDSNTINEYTGLFKDKNLIFITAESFDRLAISKEITPTLYKMVSSGLVFNNFYQPIYPVSTSDGEYMNLTGLLPKEGVWSALESSSNSMKYSLGNMFKENGYSTYAYHNNEYNFYDRQLTHANYGFKYIGCNSGMEKKINCNLWPQSDYEMAEGTINDYINDDKFLAYYMTVSGHLNYSRSRNDMVKKNWDKVSSLKYSDTIKSYIACNYELEKMVTYLIKELKNKDKLKDTVIVIVPDHFPYGLNLFTDEISDILNENRSDKFDMFKTSLIIYSEDIKETKQIDKYSSGIDVSPTIYNLFDIKYNTNNYVGKDILESKEDGIVMLSDRSFITNKGSYDSITNKFKSFENNISDKYIKDTINKVNNSFDKSSYILTNNYYLTSHDLKK